MNGSRFAWPGGLALGIIALSSATWDGLHLLNRTADPDAHQALSFFLPIKDAFERYGEYPLFNPYLGGGIPWAGYVQNPGLTPLALLILVFGEVIAVKIWMLCVLALGGLGAYASARWWLGLSPSSSALSGAVYASAGWLPDRLHSGNYTELVLFTFPAVAAVHKALLDGRPVGLVTPLLYWALFSDSRYGPTLIALSALALVLTEPDRRWAARLRAVGLWALAYLVGIALALHKILPLLSMISRDRVDQAAAGLEHFESLSDLAWHVRSLEGDVNHVVGAGLVAPCLALVGLIACRRRSLGFAVLFALAAVISLGPGVPLSPYRLLHLIPHFDTMRSLVKYVTPIMLSSVAVLAGCGFAWLRRWLNHRADRRLVKTLLGVVALACVGPNAFESYRAYSSTFVEPAPARRSGPLRHVVHAALVSKAERYRYDATFKVTGQYVNHKNGLGTVTWYGNMVFDEPVVPWGIFEGSRLTDNPAYRGEVWPAGERDCEAPELARTYNTATLRGGTGTCREVVVNIPFDERWHSEGVDIRNADGLLGLQLNRAPDEATLRFREPRVWWGALVGLLALVGWFVVAPLLSRRMVAGAR